jgi:hypothetical protein
MDTSHLHYACKTRLQTIRAPGGPWGSIALVLSNLIISFKPFIYLFFNSYFALNLVASDLL